MDYVEYLKLMATKNPDMLVNVKEILLQYAGDNSDCDICPFYEECAKILGQYKLPYCEDFLTQKLYFGGVLL